MSPFIFALVTLIVVIILIFTLVFVYLKKNKDTKAKDISFIKSVLKLSLIPEIIIFVIGVPFCIFLPILYEKITLIPFAFLLLVSSMMGCYMICNIIVAIKHNYKEKKISINSNNN